MMMNREDGTNGGRTSIFINVCDRLVFIHNF